MRLPLALAAALALAACGKAPVAGLGDLNGGATRDAGPASTRDGGTTIRDAGPITVRDGGDTFVPDSGPFPYDGGPDFPPPPDGGPVDAHFRDGGDTPIFDGGTRDGGVVTPPRDGGVVTPPRDGGVPNTPDAGVECTSNSDCQGIGPNDFCDLGTFTCVECLVDNHCGFNEVCDTQYGHVCRNECFNNQCPPGRVCDVANDVCVECLTSADCDNLEVCSPTTRECVQCTTNADCALVPNRPFCDLSESECVGCLSDADCPTGQECFEYQNNFCATAQNRAICEPCISDAECGGADDLCIGWVNSGGLIDRSCSPGCSNNSQCPRGWECVSVRQNDQVCRPRYDMSRPTCTAERNLGEACSPDPQDVDPECGITGLQDARCVVSGATGAAQCSFWCDDNDDCPIGRTCTNVNGTQFCL